MREFDLIVIGSGSGLDVAVAAANYGKKVAIVERGPLGGTCLNKGCIPSKMLIHSADVMETIRSSSDFGIEINGYSVDFHSIVKRVTDEVDGESKQIEESLKASENPVLFKSDCKFVGDKEVQVDSGTITAEKILIAAGSRPKIPEIDGLASTPFITSEEALRMQAQPKSMIILGGGYIAAEMAHFFGSLGTKIAIVQRKKYLVPGEDEEVSQEFTSAFGKKYDLYTEFEPTSVVYEGGAFSVKIKNVVEKEVVLNAEALLVAVGRVPNSDTLDLDKTGVRTDTKGYIITDNYLETTMPGIFALGDIVGRYPFKHSANLEAEYALQNILMPDQKVPVDYSAMPHAIFSSPQIAGVGKTEQDLKREGIDYLVSKWRYQDSGMGQAIRDNTGFVKLLLNKKDLAILGCHIMGTDASIMIHEVVVAMKCGNASVFNILNAVHVHPALPEVIKRAASNIRFEEHSHEHTHEQDPGEEAAPGDAAKEGPS